MPGLAWLFDFVSRLSDKERALFNGGLTIRDMREFNNLKVLGPFSLVAKVESLYGTWHVQL